MKNLIAAVPCFRADRESGNGPGPNGKNTMRNIVIGGVAAAMLALGGAGTAAAAPSDGDTLTYLQMLNNDGMTVNDVGQAIGFAHWTCSEMARGYDAHQIRDIAWNISRSTNGLTYRNVLDMVEDAAINFCPQTWQNVIDAMPSRGSMT